MERHRGRRNGFKRAETLFDEVIRDLRKHRGFTQVELAFESGFSETYICQLERGKRNPSLRTIIAIASALDTVGSELLVGLEWAGCERR